MQKHSLLRLLVLFGLLLAACRTSVTPPSASQPAATEQQTPGSTDVGIEPALNDPPGFTPEAESAEPTGAAPVFETPAIPPTPLAAGLLPAGSITLITLGDSLTEGSGDNDLGIGYPGRLLAKIETIRPGSTLFNYGHSGWSSDDLIKGIQDTPSQLDQALKTIAAAQAAGQPALVTIWIGSNDLWYLYEYGPEPMTSEAEAADLANFRHNVQTILAQVRAAGAYVLIAQGDDQSLRPVVSNPPNPAEPAFTTITPTDRQRMSIQIGLYNQAIAELADQYGAGVVDFYHTNLFVDGAALDGDGNHPNSAGYDQIAAIWFQAVIPLFDK